MKKKQSGFYIFEALVAALVFVIGVVGVVRIAAKFTTVQTDAQYRAEAAKYASEIIDTIWTNVKRDASTSDVNVADLQTFAYGSSSGYCSFSGSGNRSEVSGWVARVQAATGLPGSDDGRQLIDVAPGQNNRVTVTICWKAPSDMEYRQHVLSAYVN